MKLSKSLLICFTAITPLLHGNQTETTPSKGPFYLKIGSGVSYSKKADVDAPASVWDLALEGYDSDFGNRGIYLAGVGYEFISWASCDLTVALRPHFKYRKFQTGIPSADTPGYLGNTKTRKFDLDITSAMFTAYFTGYGVRYLDWKPGIFPGSFYPLIGGGVGMSRFTISNFRTTGLSSNAGLSPLKAFASSNDYTVRSQFSYQLLGGFGFRYLDKWAFSLGYRWFDAGKFKCPSYLRDKTGLSFSARGKEWRTHFKANEFFIEFNFFL